MKVSDLIEAMGNAGAPMEAILIAVRALEDSEAALNQRRAVERDRKRRQREKERDSHGTVTGQSEDKPDTPLSRPPNENNSNPPTHTPVSTTPARKAHRLPADWQPEPLTGETAEACARWPPKAIERELARFRDWAASATGKAALKLDWQAAWRNWIRRVEDEGRYGTNARSSGNQSNRNAVAAALDKRIGLDEPARQADRRAIGTSDGAGPRAIAGPSRL